MKTNELKSVSLFCQQGSSDKEYHVRIEARDGGFVVTFAYGRRGSTLNTGTKTPSPVCYEAATKAFDKLVKSKTAKGYRPDGESVEYTESARSASGLLPQLLNPIEDHEITVHLQDDRYCLQEKMDGKRLLLRKQGNQIEGINRKGQFVGIPKLLVQDAKALPGDFVMDGEIIGQRLFVFDLLFDNGRDIRTYPYDARRIALLNVMARGMPKHIQIVETWTSTDDKRRAFHELREVKAEGVVFKQHNAAYMAGRPNSGGPQLKFKFCATLSAVVSEVNRKRSVGMKLLGKDGWSFVGNVTIPPNKPVPGIGDVIEVRYLYGYQNGSLYQPVYLGPRDDLDHSDCVQSQVKLKGLRPGHRSTV